MRMRHCVAGALALAAALACAPPAPAVETGVNETLNQTVPTARTAARLRAGWVRLWATWESMQPAPGRFAANAVAGLDARVRAARAHGLKVLVVVVHSPGWASGGLGGIAPPSDPASWGAFMGGLAQRVPGADAWELWNEPDSPDFFRGAPDPARYAAMLRAAYPAIKAVQPGDAVVTGGLVANDMDFVAALYDHGAGGYFDAVGVHTDTACLIAGPGSYYRDERGRIGRYTFTGYREVHDVMERHGDGGKPIWLTEIGWSSHTTAPGSCPIGASKGRKPLGVTEARQARFLTAAYRCAAADRFIGAVFWFGLQDIPHVGHARGYGLYRRNGRAKPAARAFRRLARGVRARRCGGRIDQTPPTLRVVKPADGLRFAGKLDVDVRAADNRGGTGLRRIHLDADGRHVRSWGTPRGRIRPWWATRTWPPGPHTLTFRVSDRAHNETTVTVHVHKLRRR